MFMYLPDRGAEVFRFAPLSASQAGLCALAAVLSVGWFEALKLLLVSA